jgi:PST family polysaccharide transporter
MVARFVNALIQIGSVLFLARMLSPEDYGLVSMVTSITGFATIFVDLGTRDAVVQRRRITQGEVSALFWIVLGVGTAFSLIVAASGPFMARFYGEPRLTAIALVNSLTFVSLAVTCQHSTLLRRAMKFNELALLDVGSNLLSVCFALTLALYGFGYWALVLKPIVAYWILGVGTWAMCRWMPTRPTMTGGVREMLKFGRNLTGFTMTDFAGRSSDRVAIGYRIGAAGLGQYQNALFVYDNLLDMLVLPLHAVAVASLSKLRNDLSELRRLWAKALSTVVFYAMPAFGLLAVTSQDLIVFLLGKKWAPAGILLSMLALRGIPHCVERTLGWLHVTAGRTDRWLRWGLFALLAQLVALGIGLPFGSFGVATAYVACTFALFVPAIAYAGYPLEIGVLDVVKVIAWPLVGSLAAAGVGFMLRPTLIAVPILIKLMLLTAAYLGSYLILVMGVFGMRTPLWTALSLLRDVLPRRLRSPRAENRLMLQGMR